MKRTTQITLYIVFALVALVFFLYFRFPSETVKYALAERVRQLQPDVQLDMDVVSPAIPPGFKMEGVSIGYAELPIIRMNTFKITPNLFYLLSSSSSRYAYRADIGSGDLRGRAVTMVENNREQSKITMTLNRVPLNYIEILNQWTSYEADGELDATINYDSLKGGGTADVNLEVSPLRIAFDPPIMDIAALDFSQFKSQLVLTERMLQIKNGDAIGNQIHAKVTGSIVFREPFDESRITLSLTLKPQPAFIADHKNDIIGGLLSTPNARKRGVVFRISGTINNPRYVIR